MPSASKPSHVAFKCNWNDGGTDEHFPGWAGVCSRETLVANVKAGRPWCKNPRGDCAAFVADDIPYSAIRKTPCYESAIFRRGQFSSGPKKRLRGTAPGKLAIFTSREPGRSEAERVVIGVMRIGEPNALDKEFGGFAARAIKGSIVRLTREQFVPYWSTKNPDWARQLVRYLKDAQVNSILYELKRKHVDLSPLLLDTLEELSPAASQPTDSDFGDPPNDNPAELQAFARRVRRGQKAFREKLLYLYEGRCAVSREDAVDGVPQALEACHIYEHAKAGVNALSNGLLLRADIHTLFDEGLIAIDPASLLIRVAPALAETEYRALDKRRLHTRRDGSQPGEKWLKKRWMELQFSPSA